MTELEGTLKFAFTVWVILLNTYVISHMIRAFRSWRLQRKLEILKSEDISDSDKIEMLKILDRTRFGGSKYEVIKLGERYFKVRELG